MMQTPQVRVALLHQFFRQNCYYIDKLAEDYANAARVSDSFKKRYFH